MLGHWIVGVDREKLFVDRHGLRLTSCRVELHPQSLERFDVGWIDGYGAAVGQDGILASALVGQQIAHVVVSLGMLGICLHGGLKGLESLP